MDKQATDVLTSVANRTNSDIIYFVIVVAVVLLVLMPIMYASNRKDKKDARMQQIESQRQLILVIQQNTAVNAELKTMLETNNINCVECKYEHQNKLERLEEKIDTNNEKLIEKIDAHNDKIVEVALLLKQKQVITVEV